MKMNKINAEQICSLRVFTKKVCTHYEYKEEKRFLGFLIKESGYYFTYTISTPNLVSESQILSNNIYYLEDKIVYYKPHLIMTTSDNNCHIKYFDNEQGLNDFMQSDLMKSIKWIDIKE